MGKLIDLLSESVTLNVLLWNVDSQSRCWKWYSTFSNLFTITVTISIVILVHVWGSKPNAKNDVIYNLNIVVVHIVQRVILSVFLNRCPALNAWCKTLHCPCPRMHDDSGSAHGIVWVLMSLSKADSSFHKYLMSLSLVTVMTTLAFPMFAECAIC